MAHKLKEIEHGRDVPSRAVVREYRTGQMIELTWDHTEDEYDRGLFRLHLDGQTYLFDKEEWRHWLGQV